jgi:AbrB family looped-hinge helix DNA binding protein
MKMVVDKAGRTVIPKALRDKLRLAPGAELEATVEDGQLVARPTGPEVILVEENGRLVLTTTEPVPPMSTEELVDFIHQLREERMDDIMRAADEAGKRHRQG